MIFLDEFIADESQIRSVLDYFIEINKLPPDYSYYVALTGEFDTEPTQWLNGPTQLLNATFK